MKTLKQITFALVLLISFNTYASTVCIEDTENIKNELIIKMSEDEDVVNVLVNLNVLSFIESAKSEYNLSGEKFNINYEEVAQVLNTNVKNIKAKFPEFYNLDKKEQVEVLNGAKRISRRVKDFLNCVGSATAGIVTTCGIGFTGWAYRKWSACMLVGGLTVTAVEIFTEGAATGAIEVEIKGMTTSCFRFSLRMNQTQAVALVACFLPAFITSLVECGTNTLLND